MWQNEAFTTSTNRRGVTSRIFTSGKQPIISNAKLKYTKQLKRHFQNHNKTGHARINVTLRRVHATTVPVEKQYVLHIMGVCFSLRYPVSSMHCACSILSSVACPATKFFHLSHKRHDFPKKKIEYKMCVLMFSTTFVWNTSHSTCKVFVIVKL
jgi:hypothetical protein